MAGSYWKEFFFLAAWWPRKVGAAQAGLEIKINHSIHSPLLLKVPSALHCQEEFTKETSLLCSVRDGFPDHECLTELYEEEVSGILLRFSQPFQVLNV